MSHGVRYAHFRALYFVGQMPIGFYLPFFVLHLRDEVGLTPLQISYVFSIGGLVMLLFQQAWGYAADVWFSKRTLLILTTVGSGLLFAVLGGIRDFSALISIYFFYTVLSTPVFQLQHALLFTHEGSHHRFGGIRAYGSLGFVVANMAAGIVADRFTGGRVWFVFPAYLATAIVAALIAARLPERRHVNPHRPTFVAVQTFFMRRPEVALFLLMVFFYQAAHTLSYALQGLLMAGLGADNRTIAMSYSLAAVLEIPVFFAANRLIRRFGEMRLMAAAAATQAVRWVLVWAADTPQQIVMISALHAITFGVFFACAVSYMNTHAGPYYKASAQTLLALVYFGMASLIGNLAGGQVMSGGILASFASRAAAWIGLPDHGDLANLYLFSAFLAVLALVLAIAHLALERREPHAGASVGAHPD